MPRISDGAVVRVNSLKNQTVVPDDIYNPLIHKAVSLFEVFGLLFLLGGGAR